MPHISQERYLTSAHFCSNTLSFNTASHRGERPSDEPVTNIYILGYDATAESTIQILGESAYKCLPEANVLSLTHDLTKGFEKAKKYFEGNITDDARTNLYHLSRATEEVFNGLPYASKYDINQILRSEDPHYQICLMEPEKCAVDLAKVAKLSKRHKFVQNVIDVPVKAGFGLVGIGILGILACEIANATAPNFPYYEPLVSSFVDAAGLSLPATIVFNILQGTNHLWHHFATKGEKNRLALNEGKIPNVRKMFRHLTS